jgi:hypothetical protein
MELFITTGYAVFVILMNTAVQLFISKKSISLFTVVWIRDMVSALVLIYLGLYWQLWIVLWQFLLTYTGYLCWRHEDKTGNTINQIQLIKSFFYGSK